MVSTVRAGTRRSLRHMDSMEEALNPTQQSRTSPPHDASSLGTGRQAVLVAILLLGLLFSSLDASIVSTSLVAISSDLSNFLDAPWVVLSYLLAYLGCAVMFSRLSDIYGRRALLVISWLLFTAFSLGCGLSRNMLQLIVCRTFQGVGGSGLYSLAQIGLFEIGPSHNPHLLGALVGLTLAVSFVLGPILGGTISHLADWKWIFLVNVPCGAFALLILLLIWPGAVKEQLRLLDALRRIDVTGNLLLMCASTLLVFALQQAGSFDSAWSSPVIIVSLTVATVSLITFAIWEVYLGLGRLPRFQPVFPLRLITLRPFLATVLCTLFTGYSYLALIVVLPERFQIVNSDNSLMSGVHLLPTLGSTAFGSFLSGSLSSTRNNTSATLITAACLQLIGVGLLSTLSDSLAASKAQYGFQTIYGLGVGLSLGGGSILTAVHSRPDDLAVAHGAVAQARVLGGAIGIAISSIIFNSHVEHDLQNVLSKEQMAQIRHSPTLANQLPQETQSVVRGVYAAAFADDTRLMIAICALGLVSSLFTFEIDPPPMPHKQKAASEVTTERADSGETELDDIRSVRSRPSVRSVPSRSMPELRDLYAYHPGAVP